MTPSRHAAMVPLDPRVPSPLPSAPLAVGTRAGDTPRTLPDDEPSGGPPRDRDAPRARAATDQAGAAAVRLSPSLPPSASNSQASAASASTASTDQVVTPPASDTSAGLDGPGPAEAVAGDVAAGLRLQLSAAQRGVAPDGASSRKRMADGAVKSRGGSASPAKGHSRTTSTVSMASTSGSNIGGLSSELKTLLSYAMVKVSHGWQSRSLDEVESLASQAASPTSSVSTAYRRHGSSASPRQPAALTTARRTSHSPPPPPVLQQSPGKPALAPPASIQPSPSLGGAGPNSRRNSNPRHAPAMLSHPSAAASPRTPGLASRPDVGQPPVISRAEQDVAESLLFMSSPGNSTNLKHGLSSQQSIPTRAAGGRHALPSGPRKALPSQRPVAPSNKTAGMPPPPTSPMDVDAPRQSGRSPNRGTPKRRASGATSHVRAALSLPSGLGLGRGSARKPLRDDDIERMLDRAGAEPVDSSDDEIQLPRGRRDMTGIMVAHGAQAAAKGTPGLWRADGVPGIFA